MTTILVFFNEMTLEQLDIHMQSNKKQQNQQQTPKLQAVPHPYCVQKFT